MILKLALDHGYSYYGINQFGDLLGTDITLEQLAELSKKIGIWICPYNTGEPNTIYVAHPRNV